MKTCNFKKELKLGIHIEKEHTHLFPKKLQKIMPRKIALDHLKENPCYYSRGLIPMEKKLSKLNIRRK